MKKTAYFHIIENKEGITLQLHGNWRIESLDTIEKSFNKLLSRLSKVETITLDLSGLQHIDTGAMVFFISMRQKLKKIAKVRCIHIPDEFCRMFRLVRKYTYIPVVKKSSPLGFIIDFLANIGKRGEAMLLDFILFLDFLGQTAIAFARLLLHPALFRHKETAANIYKAGATAIPIIALSAFLVGIVIAFQSAVQLQKYGANIFIVDMIGISIPRELAPLISAIIVAGRSGSSYTAQIGVMKITEEIDAMKTMGFEIFRFLVLPRIIAMMVALPLLIFFADIIGIYGGMLVAKMQLGITPAQFLDRLHNEVDVRHYYIGLFKGPFFAFIIAAIGCFRGFQVSGNTESIGRYTTISVVNSIFLVIAMDAIFSVIFTELDI
ncbi:MlaE family lipid ABC transporter permease subunit [Hydrogenimonas sp.]